MTDPLHDQAAASGLDDVATMQFIDINTGLHGDILVKADRAAMALLALQNQRRPEEHIEVTFDDRPPGAPEPASTPQTPDEVTPPARAPAEATPPAQTQAERSG